MALAASLPKLKALLEDDSQSAVLIQIGGFAAAYAGVHALALGVSKLLLPAGYTTKSGANIDDANPKYAGATLRKIAAARIASFTHAGASLAFSARAVAQSWPRLRDAAARRGTGPPSALVRLGLGDLPLLAYDAPTTPLARAALCHSLGYFVQELAHLLAYEPDPIFAAHHVAYLLAASPLAAAESGWAMVSVATLFAEATNPLQLSWELARAFGYSATYEALSLPFTFSFAAVRGCLMPLALGDMFLFVRAHEAPLRMKAALGLFAVGMCASVAWLAQLISGFRRYRRKKAAAAEQKKKG
mmetsp:Transcript_6519/g.19267  ORF Transcript_6519/g.19267 Transcript_6519/m.19267 type:complete len:302 (+) Transcript_6519:201-1106(+)|eukprot:CAMPEP_0119259256 /NCGR_PEP_ID=MMETSP1329-20130426/146_1 /TAXON_ID=114041 /ORGANISM="Genus nov. species nov., Strain RCC1024" /LENGTH=301 /DNA_ID=CAMNT_0007258625 /DNA_START=173 /DNA_END=1078 /DNA_ORIENTATION=+